MTNARIALVTGASKGLGEAVATYLARAGWDLVVTARNDQALAEAASELRASGGRVVAVAGDVVEAVHRRALVDAARELGGLDLLVNNASELGPSPMPALADYPLDALGRVLAVNLLAPVGLVQEARALLGERRGLVVNVTSDAAAAAYPGWGGYGASKAALELASRTLAAELGGEHVGVVSVDPGDLRTAMHQAAFPGEDISDRPAPDVTIPFWAWLVDQDPATVTGRRFEAQGERWEAAS